jgi:hypothetical protein
MKNSSWDELEMGKSKRHHGFTFNSRFRTEAVQLSPGGVVESKSQFWKD